MDLLKFSLTSATPLTDLIMKTTQTTSIATKPEAAGILFPNIQKGDAKPKQMVLKVCLQKSTNRFLFAEATDEFTVFLFSFLSIPVAGVEFLLGGNTCFKSIDNLYGSVADLIDSKGNYVKKHTVCFVTDDLTVSPSLTTSISILNGLGIPLSDVEETELSVGMEEVILICFLLFVFRTSFCW